MSGFGKRVDGPDGRRRSARLPVMAAASALSRDGSRPVLVENLSANGAKLRGRNLPPVGKQVLVWMEDKDALGRIAWAEFNQAGVTFEEPLAI